MTLDDMLDQALAENADALFQKLKQRLIQIEARGFRPVVTTHGNGMLDTLRIEQTHATTPEVDRIRAERKAESPAHGA
jgi:hypothetical protein